MAQTTINHGKALLDRLNKIKTNKKPLALIGIFDCLSSAIAANNPNVEALFLSGLGITASRLGWPDIGFLNPQMVRETLIQLRGNHPNHYIISDIDGGLGNKNTVISVVKMMDQYGASAFTIEDQKDETKKCGHFGDKEVIPIDEFKDRIKLALDHCGQSCVIARTDAPIFDQALERVSIAAELGAPIVLVDGLDKPEKIIKIKQVANNAYIMVNLIQGGKMAPISMTKLHKLGASIINFSIPLLEPAIYSMINALNELYKTNGVLPANPKIGLKGYNDIFHNIWQQYIGNHIDDKSSHQEVKQISA